MTTPERGLRRTACLWPVGAIAAAAAALLVAVPAPSASALPCDLDGGCRHGIVSKAPDWQTGWILYADRDGRGSYWTWGVYRQDSGGHCFDTRGTGVGCPG